MPRYTGKSFFFTSVRKNISLVDRNFLVSDMLVDISRRNHRNPHKTSNVNMNVTKKGKALQIIWNMITNRKPFGQLKSLPNIVQSTFMSSLQRDMCKQNDCWFWEVDGILPSHYRYSCWGYEMVEKTVSGWWWWWWRPLYRVCGGGRHIYLHY